MRLRPSCKGRGRLVRLRAMWRHVLALVPVLFGYPALAQDAAAPAAAPAPLPTLPAESVASPAGNVALLPHELSPWSMFLSADIVVQTVMVGLLIASVATWTVWLAKTVELSGAKRRVGRALAKIGQSISLAEAADAAGSDGGAATRMLDAAQAEIHASIAARDKDGIKERVASRLERIEAASGRSINRGTGILATIGATAPFVGLFGTVWGIMNSFIGISVAHTTNLAVVAPGIAEALLATAIGLFAAIPAVVMYNAFARSIAAYRAQLGDTSAAVMRLVSRDLDRDPAAKPVSRVKAAE